MDEVTSAESMSSKQAGNGAAANGLAPQIAAVEAARERLGRDLDQLNVEVRAQWGQTMEKTTWKLVGTGSAILASILVRNVMMSLWRSIVKTDPPNNPAQPGTAWGEALAWTAATGVGVGIARMLASRGAAAGWQRATGALPPGLEDVS